jgi:hypothetical protein
VAATFKTRSQSSVGYLVRNLTTQQEALISTQADRTGKFFSAALATPADWNSITTASYASRVQTYSGGAAPAQPWHYEVFRQSAELNAPAPLERHLGFLRGQHKSVSVKSKGSAILFPSTLTGNTYYFRKEGTQLGGTPFSFGITTVSYVHVPALTELVHKPVDVTDAGLTYVPGTLGRAAYEVQKFLTSQRYLLR